MHDAGVQSQSCNLRREFMSYNDGMSGSNDMDTRDGLCGHSDVQILTQSYVLARACRGATC